MSNNPIIPSLPIPLEPSTFTDYGTGSHEDLFAEALKIFNQGKYADCIKLLIPLAELGDFVARKYLLACYYRLDQNIAAYEQAQYLIQYADERKANWARYMMGTIEMHWGNYHRAIQILQSIPQRPPVALNLAIAYWKKYKVYKDLAALDQILPLLENLEDRLKPYDVHKIPHLRGLICQVNKEYSLSKQWYRLSISMAPTRLDQASTLNDLAGLYIELGQLDAAEKILHQAKDLLINEREAEQAVNYRWFGLLVILQNKPKEAKAYFEKAITIFRDKEFLGEMAHTSAVLDYATNPLLTPVPFAPAADLLQERMQTGIRELNRGEYIKAIEYLSPLANQSHPESRQYLAICYYQLNLLDAAHEHFLFLSERNEPVFQEWGISMAAMLEMMRGQFGEALKRLRSLPNTPRNLVNLSLVYFKKYLVIRDEFSIFEALRLLKTIRLQDLSPCQQQKLHQLMALVYQVQHVYGLAESSYHKALELSTSNQERASVYNDLASLAIERGEYIEAEKLLQQARDLVQESYPIESALNHKWTGMLATVQKRYEEARIHLERAAKVIRNKELFQELASILYILADSTRKDNFYQAAEYFADGLKYEQLSEEIYERDDKIIRFYHDGFFHQFHK